MFSGGVKASKMRDALCSEAMRLADIGYGIAAKAAFATSVDLPKDSLVALFNVIAVASAVENDFSVARQMAASGMFINAIRQVRIQTGLGLKEAKELVESWPEYKYR